MAARFCVEGMDKDAVATVGIHSMRAAWEDADVLIDGHAKLAVRDELDTTTVLESPGAVLYDDGKDKEDKELLGAEKRGRPTAATWLSRFSLGRSASTARCGAIRGCRRQLPTRAGPRWPHSCADTSAQARWSLAAL